MEGRERGGDGRMGSTLVVRGPGDRRPCRLDLSQGATVVVMADAADDDVTLRDLKHPADAPAV